MKALRSLVLLVSLTACASPEEIRQRQQAQHDAYLYELRSECRGFGFYPDTPEMAQCMQNAHNQRLLQAQARRAASDAALMNALGAYSIMNQATKPYTLPSNTLNCTTYQRGPYGNISCF